MDGEQALSGRSHDTHASSGMRHSERLATMEMLKRRSSTLVPLTDIAAHGGLYGDANTMPTSHHSSAPLLEPIDGIIGFASIAMSNGRDEWAAFTSLAQERDALDSRIMLANGAVRSRTMRQWNDPRNQTWERALARMATSGTEPHQIQVVWMKMGSKLHELGLGPTQRRVEMEREWLQNILADAAVHLPNLRRVYMSSRIYAGYAGSTNHLEPVTGFDNGLAVRAVVAGSIAGHTPVWTAWGPYLWANGSKPRIDGLAWHRGDFADDGLHPSRDGARKVGTLLFDFFSTEATTKWMFQENRI